MNEKIKIAFATLGCKLNFAETSSIQGKLKVEKYEIVPFSSEADVYIINSCSVTEAADKKGRNLVSRAYRCNPAAKIIVIGCQSQVNAKAVSELEGVSLVLGNSEKFDLGKWIEKELSGTNSEKINVNSKELKSSFFPAMSYTGRTRCFIKIQDGCDYFCSYCIVPYARGRSRNAGINDVVSQVRSAEEKGVKEIVLTGVNIGDFGKTTGESLTDLIIGIIEQTKVPRIRLGSIEPDLISDELLISAATQTRIMPHFHLPL